VCNNPTVKEEIQQKRDLFKDDVTFGFLGYPVSQAADILIFQADLVPVGSDQLPMIEQAREIAKKFNRIYGETFKLPEAKLGDFPRVMGIDGKKMGKSLNNSINLADSPEEIKRKIKGALTGEIGGKNLLSIFEQFSDDKRLIEKFNKELKIPGKNDILSGRSFSELIKLAQEATEWALVKAARPNCTIIMPQVSPYYWGALLFFFEVATAFEGELLSVNAFDQPGVEGYKNYMYYKLGKPGISQAIAQEIQNKPLIKEKKFIL